MADSVLISLNNISKTYTLEGVNSRVLDNICVEVHAGEMLAIIGASGSGKSTLMNILGLLDKADSGHYFLQQQSVSQLNDDETAKLRNKAIGFVFQQFNLLPRFTASQNVALPLIYRALTSQKTITEKVMTSLERVGMQNYAGHRPTQLSGGQQQRIAIARALVGEPQIILADEPTGALDSKTSSEIMDLFTALNNEGRTLIIVTHDKGIAARCQREISLTDGHIVSERIL